MNSEVDTSILNSVNIKRFTNTVLEEYGGEIDRSNSAKWIVTFPDELAWQLDRQHGTLVFDPADRELGAGDLLIQPGTQVFSALLDLVQEPGSVGRLRLTEDTLQVNPPSVLRESDLSVAITDFSKSTSDFALSFHFRVQFETPSSFHSEEMFSVTVDPETQTRLPDLTARLTSHLPQLLQQNNEHPPQDISRSTAQQSFEEAQQAVIERSRPIISDIQTEADESANERIGEISDWYKQRRNELDQQVRDQRQEIRKWQQKRQNARKNSTRREYTKNEQEARTELDQLQTRTEKKKQELDREESAEIDDVIKRNEIAVDVSLLGATEVTYVRGTLSMELDSGHAKDTVDVSYLPATDEFRGLNCHVCSQDLTDGVRPQLCANGHLIGDPCSTSCRSCGLAYCTDCETTAHFAACEICWEDVCQSCVTKCQSCETTVCTDHNSRCSTCNATTCHLCGEKCATCGEFHCEAHLDLCPDCGEYHCTAHLQACDSCGSVRCGTHIDHCRGCSDLVCSDHRATCTTCEGIFCDRHLVACDICSAESDQEQRHFCHQHTTECTVGGEVICSAHRTAKTIGSGYICDDHRSACRSCKVEYSEDVLADRRCSACTSIGEADEKHIPDEITEEFRSVEAGGNNAYMVILGKRLLGRNKLVVYDLQANEESHRRSAGMLKQLRGEYQ